MVWLNIHLLLLTAYFAPQTTALSAYDDGATYAKDVQDHTAHHHELLERGVGLSTLLGNKNILKLTNHTVNVVVKGPGSTKSQTLPLMVDTGSTDLVLFTRNCQGCWTANEHVAGYKEGDGTGKKPYHASYGDPTNSASMDGHREMATVKLGKFASHQTVAAITSARPGARGNKLSASQAGTIGFGLHPPDQPVPFWRSQFSTFGIGFNKAKTLNGNELKGNGTLALGSYDHSIVKNPASIEWNPLVVDTMWTVNVDVAGPAGRMAPPAFGAGVALVDTGSNLISGPPAVVQKIYGHLAQHGLITGASVTGDGAYTFDCGGQGRFELQLNGEQYQIRLQDFEIPTGMPGQCHGILLEGGTPPGVDWILGVPFLRTVYTIFDAEHQRIGFYRTS